MVKNHMKRLSAPRHWLIQRKENVYITRPKPGKPFELAMPLSHIMKTQLGVADTTKQVRDILFHTGAFVNGTRVYEHRRPVYLFDVITFPASKQAFMMSLSAQGKLLAVSIDEAAAKKRLVKVKNKTRRANKVQINCLDGSNITVDKDTYKTGDTIALEGKKIVGHFPLTEQATVMLTGGSNISSVGTVSSIEGDVVVVKTKDQELSTHKRHIFVVGKDKPEVQLQ